MTALDPRAAPFLPAITSLPTLSDAALTSTLDLLFEPSAELQALALPTMRAVSFDGYEDLISTLRDAMLLLAAEVRTDDGARDRLHSMLGSHPRLGERAAGEGLSGAEQSGLTSPGGDEAERLAAMNREYEERFPGLRYVVFVNGRGRDVILQDMRRRIDRGDLAAEEKESIEVREAALLSIQSQARGEKYGIRPCWWTIIWHRYTNALQAMCDIALDRAAKLQAAVPAPEEAS